jgi:Tfp pilus assembly protein PilN
MSNQRTADRRTTDRRQAGERRRVSETRRVVFELCRSDLNLALVVETAEGEKVVTRSLRWRNTAPSLHTDRGIEELTDAFRTLVADERLAGAKVRIALGGEFCVSRVVTGSTDEVRREFAALEERSLRYLTLGPGRKALCRNIQPLDARHQHAMLTVTSQKTLDLLLRVAGNTGVQIEAIEPSLIALSRAQANLRGGCNAACLLIQFDESAAELGICHKGRLLLEYRPGGKSGSENIAAVVGQHLFRLQRYLNRYHSYLDEPLRHVYLTGDPASVEMARQKFALLSQLEVHVLDPSDLNVEWQHVAEAPNTQMAAVLGTALSFNPNAVLEQGPNLIEVTLAQMRAPLRPMLIRSFAPVAALLAVAVGLLALHLVNLGKIAALRSELVELQPIQARATELRLQLMTAEGKAAQLHKLDRKLPRPNWQELLTHFSQSMPDDVWLDRLSINDGQLATLGGASYSDGGVYDFVNYLKDVPHVAEIALEGTGASQNESGPTTTFDLKATLAGFAEGTE